MINLWIQRIQFKGYNSLKEENTRKSWHFRKTIKITKKMHIKQEIYEKATN